MSTSATGSATLSAGLQTLLNDGFLPNNVSTATLAKATPSQIAGMAAASIEQSNVNALFMVASSTDTLSPTTTAAGDSVSLSDVASALLGEAASMSSDTATAASTAALLAVL